MLKHAGYIFHSALLALIHEAWRVGKVPQVWRNTELITIPKRGDLSSCDSWRGIALLDVVGKALGCLLQNRLQVVTELELPETQCGFRQGRSCKDHIFTLLQSISIEKFNENRASGYIVFVDLCNAYDSVPRGALWKGLAVLGVPASLIDLISSFHTGMISRLQISGQYTNDIAVNNGLRQGYPSLLFSST